MNKIFNLFSKKELQDLEKFYIQNLYVVNKKRIIIKKLY